MFHKALSFVCVCACVALLACSSNSSGDDNGAGGSAGSGGVGGEGGSGGAGGSGAEGGAGGQVAPVGRIEVSDASFLVPTLAAGQRADRTIEITNTGDGPANISRFNLEINGGTGQLLYGVRQVIGIAADGEDLFETQERYPLELSAGATLPLTLEYTAGDAPPSGQLTITGDFEGETLVLPIEAVASVGQIAAEPDSLDFGRVRNNTEATLNVTVRNTGMATLNITEIAKDSNVYFHMSLGDGDPTEDAALYEDPDGDGNPGVAPGGSFDLSVRFAPTREGTQQTTIIIDSDDPLTPELRIPIVGNPVTGCIMVSHEALMWEGEVREVTPSPEVSITNCGETPLTLDALGLLTGSSANFEFDPLMNVPEMFPAEIPAGADPITFRVNYGPPDARVYRGNIEILSNDPENHTIILPMAAESRCANDMDCAMGYRCEETRCVEIMQMMP